MQVALLRRLACLKVDPYDNPRPDLDVTAAQARYLLDHPDAAAESTQVPGLLHTCYKCGADVVDTQTWKRHMKKQHVDTWGKLEPKLARASLAHTLARPCPYCETCYQKTPQVHIGKCLAIQQLLAAAADEDHTKDVGSSGANRPAVGQPEPDGIPASTEGSKVGERKRRREEPSQPASEAQHAATQGDGVGRRARARYATQRNLNNAADPGQARARSADAGSVQELCAVPVHEGVVDPASAVQDQPGVEDQAREWPVRFLAADLPHDMLELQARLKKAEGDPLQALSQQAGWQTAERSWRHLAWSPGKKIPPNEQGSSFARGPPADSPGPAE